MFTKKFHRTVVIFVTVALLAAGCGGGATTAAAVPTTAALSEVQGQVDILNPGEADASPAADGMTLQVEGQIATGADGRLRLDLSTGTVIRLAPGTIFTLVSNDPQREGLLTRIKLEAGRMWIALNGGSLDVETPAGLASVRGSNLMVWVDPSTLNVYVNCFEGDCGAGNDSGSLDLTTGNGAILYYVETGGSPPPPGSYALTWQDFQDWLANNPEAGNILPDIIQTLTAIPTFTSTPTATPTPLPTATATPSCFTLLSPADGANLPAEGQVDFTWTEYPGAYKYIVTFIQPNGYASTVLAWTPSLSQYIEAFADAGTYQWKVTVKNADIQDICTAGPFTFTKPQSVVPTPVPTVVVPTTPKPGNTDTTFSNISGPGNSSSNCVNFFQVDAYDPEGLMYVKVQYQVFDGSDNLLNETYQHLSISAGITWSGNLAIASLVPGSKVVWWFWAIDNQGNSTYSGTWTFDYAGYTNCQ
jgi:hypothetical protein